MDSTTCEKVPREKTRLSDMLDKTRVARIAQWSRDHIKAMGSKSYGFQAMKDVK